ncbi:hypothetical protein ZHAS_00006459 [Anopheles sinensis]|uniref:Uncharacterized protein n=1 Tax=Anopheles sinensis TaxID=74873 RepID=A0A084VMD6_ANOSI|nr:hypothetical protein ZHAS_00006459 [Anopheles sinensis]
MKIKLLSIVVLLFSYSRECTSERTAFEALEYQPSLEYFLKVLKFSSESLARVEFDPTVRLPSSVPKMLDSARHALGNTTLAAQSMSDALGQGGSTFQVRSLLNALHSIRGSLCQTDFHFPEYFYNQSLAEEFKQLKSTIDEQVDSLPVERSLSRSSGGWDMKLVNSIVTSASSLVMITTLVTRQIVGVEQMNANMKKLFIPSNIDQAVLQDLLEIGSHARSYNGLYREALNSGSTLFLGVASDGYRVLQSMLSTSTEVPKSLRDAVEEFTAEVLHLTQGSMAELQSTTNEADAKFTELFQNIMYASYGLESSALGMLHPLPRNMICVRSFLPIAHTLAGAQLTSLSLCNNEASLFLYEQVLQYRDQLRRLQQNAFDQLKVAVGCDASNCHAVYTETTNFFQAVTAAIKDFTPDLNTYHTRLFDCLNGKSETAMAKIVDMAMTFNYCVQRREAEQDTTV